MNTGTRQLKLDVGRLLDFCTLVSAIPLHDRLITFRAEIPTALRDSKLYKYLEDRKILLELEFDYRKFKDEEKDQMLLVFGEGFSEDEADRVLGDLQYKEYYGPNEYTQGQDVTLKLQREKYIDEVIHTSDADWSRGIPANSILKNSEALRLHRLRTAGYWVVSGQLNLAFLPDFMRIPMIAGYRRALRDSIRMNIQRSVDDVFKRNSKLESNIMAPLPIPIPDAVSNFLSRYSKYGLEDSFDYLREQFSDHKKTIVEWETRLSKSNNTLEDIDKIMKDMQDSISSLGVKMNASEIVVDILLRLPQDVLSGGIPTGTLDKLARTGHNIFQVRWRRRKISYLYNGHKEALKIGNQSDLLEKAFGSHLVPGEFSRYEDLTKAIQRLTLPSSQR
jgi:hypothetical protein